MNRLHRILQLLVCASAVCCTPAHANEPVADAVTSADRATPADAEAEAAPEAARIVPADIGYEIATLTYARALEGMSPDLLPEPVEPDFGEIRRDERQLYDVIEMFYEDRGGMPVFTEGATLSREGELLVDRLMGVGAHGLNPRDFVDGELAEMLAAFGGRGGTELAVRRFQPTSETTSLIENRLAHAAADAWGFTPGTGLFAQVVEDHDERIAEDTQPARQWLASLFESRRGVIPEMEALLAEQLLRYALAMRAGNDFYAPANPAMDEANEFLEHRQYWRRRRQRELMAEDEELSEEDARARAQIEILAEREQPVVVRTAEEWRIDEIDSLFAAAEGGLTFGEALDRLVPDFEGYRAMQAALQHYRSIAAEGGWDNIRTRERLALGDRDDELVPALRARLAVEGFYEGPTEGPEFDRSLSDALRRYQDHRQLEPSGELDALTLATLNIPIQDRIAQIIVTLGRWRSARFVGDAEAGREHIRVNIPEFSAELWDEDERVYKWRVVVGKVRGAGQNYTPLFSALMTQIELNPFWYPPARLSAGADDGGRRRYVAPGPDNPMGQAKFLFPNAHAVYMHDTNQPQYFGHAFRAYSHGCMRVEGAIDLVHLLINRDREESMEETEAFVDRIIERGRRDTYFLDELIPVHTDYRSVWMADDGTIVFGMDLYRWDEDDMDEVIERLLREFPDLAAERPHDRHMRTHTLARRRVEDLRGG